MKLLLDIQDSKALHLIQVLKGLPYVKTKQLTPYSAEILEGIKEAVEEINQVKTGKGKSELGDDAVCDQL